MGLGSPLGEGCGEGVGLGSTFGAVCGVGAGVGATSGSGAGVGAGASSSYTTGGTGYSSIGFTAGWALKRSQLFFINSA